MTYEIIVSGVVERRVTVEADNLEAAQNAAEKEWCNLTGGIIETSECVEAVEVE